MKSTYIYLIRRDSKDMKMIIRLESNKIIKPQRINKLSHIDMHPVLKNKIEQFIHDHRMYWEAWIESADSLQQLLNNLQKRKKIQQIPMKTNYQIQIDKLQQEGFSIKRQIEIGHQSS